MLIYPLWTLLTYLTTPKDGSPYSLRALLSRTISSLLRDVKLIKKNEESTTPKDGSHYSLRALLSRTISSLLKDVKLFNKNEDSTAPEDGSR